MPLRAQNQIDRQQNPPPPRPPPLDRPRNPPPPRPLPQDVIDHGHRYSLAARIHCFALRAEGYSGQDIDKKTGVSQTSQSRIWKKALERGFRPQEDPRILVHYVEDGSRPGRPRNISPETK